MENSIKDIIRRRKSVRTFDGTPLRDEDKRKLEDCLKTLENPFKIPVEFRLLNAKEHNLSSPVILGTDFYVAAKVSRALQFEIAFGYSFEKFCLYAESIGVGTVMLAATISRKTFEKAMALKENEVMPVASPIGYPAKKRSVRETMMRKGIKADERLPFETLFFEDSFMKALTPENAGRYRDALEMVRLAPSAANRQPWRIVICGDTVHFYEKKAKGMSNNELGDIQKVDIGIALAHFDLTMKEDGIGGSFVTNNPGLDIEDDMEYIISWCEN